MNNDIRIKKEFIFNFADCISDFLYSLAQNILYIADRINRDSKDQDVLKIAQMYKSKLYDESVNGDDKEELFNFANDYIITVHNIKHISKLDLNFEFKKEDGISYISHYLLNKDEFESITNYFVGDLITIENGEKK